MTLARAWQTPAMEGAAALLYVALVGFWSVVAVRTAAATRSGRIWQRYRRLRRPGLRLLATRRID